MSFVAYQHRAAAVLALSMTLGCVSPPIGVQLLDPRVVHKKLVSSALSGDELSAFTSAVLTRNGYGETWAIEPEETLLHMRSQMYWDQPDDALFALAELSFSHADRTGAPEHYLAAAVYAYAYLFEDGRARAETPNPFDPRARLAADIYNRGLTRGLRVPDDGDKITLRSGTFALPYGSIEISFNEAQLHWGRYELTDFVAAADLGVSGLRNRYRRPGLGAPLAVATRPTAELGDSASRVPAAVRVPVTALLEIETPRAGIQSGSHVGTLRLFAADAVDEVELHGQRVPLEVETTSALANTLAVSRFWETETGRFFGRLGITPGDPWGVGLAMLHPYHPDRIPVVLVHGTASSPGRWAELINEINGVPILRENFQIWLFSYETGQPIGYSAGLLRESLERTVAELDPDGDDANLQKMVVIGHSQGGLLTKLTAVDSGDAFYTLDVPFEDLVLGDEERHVLRRSVFFEPLPFVKRVVFMATPHRGSFLASWRLSRLVVKLVEVPSNIVGVLSSAIAKNPEAFKGASASDIPTSLDNMTPGHWWLNALAELPIAEGIAAHSIIAVQGNGDEEDGNDGVVEYTSAHIEGVESERVIRSPHSTQANPFTIFEVARILISHSESIPLEELPPPPEVTPGGRLVDAEPEPTAP